MGPQRQLTHRTHTPWQNPAHPRPNKPLSGCRSTNKDAMRRICRGSLPLQAEIQATLCNPSRPWSQPRDQLTRTARGSGGIAFCDSPRRLSADFAGRKRPPCCNKDKPQETPPP